MNCFLITIFSVSSFFFFTHNINSDQSHRTIAPNLDLFEFIHMTDQEDLQSIIDVFEHLFKNNELSFTLFGDKPISFCNSLFCSPSAKFSKNFSLSSYCRFFFILNNGLKKKWKTWEKYSHLFPSNKFLFIEHHDTIYLINKTEVKKTINKNINFFRATLEDEFFNAEMFLEKINCSKNLFKELKNNHALVGVLLGYGLKNSQLFQRRSTLLDSLDPYQIPIRLNFLPAISEEYKLVEKEVEKLNNRLKPINNSYHLFPLVNDSAQVNFTGDKELLETKKLQKKIRKTGKRNKRDLVSERLVHTNSHSTYIKLGSNIVLSVYLCALCV